VSLDWHQFFANNEFENAVVESQKPVVKKVALKKPEPESDSEPSCDNFNEQELAERFEAAVSEDEREEMRKQAIKQDSSKTKAVPKPEPPVVKKPEILPPNPPPL